MLICSYEIKIKRAISEVESHLEKLEQAAKAGNSDSNGSYQELKSYTIKMAHRLNTISATSKASWGRNDSREAHQVG
jgi:hypothetical protein